MFGVPCAISVVSLSVLWSARRWAGGFPRAGMAGIIAVVSIDLWLSQTQFLRLVEHKSPPIPGPIVALERYARIPGFPNAVYNNFRYCNSMDSAILNRTGYVGTHDGGVQPGTTERMFAALVSNTKPALAAASCRYVDTADDARWLTLPQCLPRIRFVPESRGPLLAVPIEKLTPEQIEQMRTGNDMRIARHEESATSIAVSIEARANGWLVLADTYYPGWHCTINGQSADIECAHGVFRTVAVPQGLSQVAFEFEPATVRVGLIGSLAGVAIWGALLILAWRRK
jgi:hypothetical protein